MKNFFHFIFMILIVIECCDSTRILGMFGAPVLSHQLVFKALMQELVNRGHEVTVITSFSVTKGEKIDNYTEIDLTHIGRKVRSDVLLKKFSQVPDIYEQFTTILEVAFRIVDEMLQSKEVQKLIKNNSFDLIFIEDCTKSSLVLSHLFKAPVIVISSFGGTFGTFEMVGAPVHPILYPLATKQRFRNLSTWEKILDFIDQYWLKSIYDDFELSQNDINKKYYGSNTPTLNDLKENIQMVFLNEHSIWDSNRPVPPNVIYLGGLHQNAKNELPKDLKTSLDSSKNGVIYMSFGTTVHTSTYSKRVLEIFIKVFSKLPYDVFWKWSDKKIPGLPKNIKMENWFPQSDLLRHPKVKLFITQGGLQSTDEAINAGVPMIGLPVLWDQWFNVDKYVQLKIGEQLDRKTITEDNLIKAINTVIDNPEYRNNIIKLRSLMLDVPQSSLERAVWWTEYVLRNGASHLRASSANMSWIDYYELEAILFAISIFVTFTLLVFAILKRIVEFVYTKLIFSYKIKVN